MDPTLLPPISGHAILILLLQLAGILLAARVLAELMRRLGQPAVIGELLAGILLGPTILGHFAPGVFTAIFPLQARQFHLLEVISSLGMVLLLLLTGLETDIRVMRRLGRAALMASVFGMAVPFASGFVLGLHLPDRFLAHPDARPIFAAFMATAMAISAMPVIAKILLDLNLIRRNLGVVILSAGVVDDTSGWLVLSIIAGIASAGAFSATRFGMTLAALAAYLIVMRWVMYPLFTRLVRYVNERVALVGADVTLILVCAFLSAAATEAIGVHAVFGAFVFGLLVRQIPRVRPGALHTIETFVLSALSPVFFAFVGLKVDLWALSGWQIPLLVIGIAVAGKMVGCYIGGRLGRMGHYEALALGFGMNARGAMELVVALIGLSLGLLTAEMYSTIVLVAVVTTFMAPLLLRIVMPRVPLTEDEIRRIEDTDRTRLIPAGALRVLIPTPGGGNAMSTFALAAPLVRHRRGSITALYVQTDGAGRRRLRRTRGASPLAGQGLDTHLAAAASRLGDEHRRLSVRRLRAPVVSEAILAEAARDYDLVMIGAAPHHLIGQSLIADVVTGLRLPAVIVRHGGEPLPERFSRIVVPIDGSVFSRAAVEFAFAYGAGTGARVTLLHVINETRVASGALAVPHYRESHAVPEFVAERIETRIREDFGGLAAGDGVPLDVRVLASGDPGAAIIGESRSTRYDLLVLGAENKLLSQSLFFGQGTAAIVEQAGCTTAVVVPYLT